MTQTAGSIASLFAALTLYPEVQKRARAQIDSVTSRDRLPTFEDKSRLPYIEAFCKELLRWQVVSPQGATSFSVVLNNAYQTLFKVYPMRQPRIASTEGSSFRKVCPRQHIEI